MIRYPVNNNSLRHLCVIQIVVINKAAGTNIFVISFGLKKSILARLRSENKALKNPNNFKYLLPLSQACKLYTGCEVDSSPLSENTASMCLLRALTQTLTAPNTCHRPGQVFPALCSHTCLYFLHATAVFIDINVRNFSLLLLRRQFTSKF